MAAGGGRIANAAPIGASSQVNGDVDMQQSEGNILEVSGGGRKSGRRQTNIPYQDLLDDELNTVNSNFKKLDFTGTRNNNPADKVQLFPAASNNTDGHSSSV